LKIPNTKRTGGVVQGVGLKFKPQFRKKKKKKKKEKFPSNKNHGNPNLFAPAFLSRGRRYAIGILYRKVWVEQVFYALQDTYP
jgi:hypothetical protein